MLTVCAGTPSRRSGAPISPECLRSSPVLSGGAARTGFSARSWRRRRLSLGDPSATSPRREVRLSSGCTRQDVSEPGQSHPGPRKPDCAPGALLEGHRYPGTTSGPSASVCVWVCVCTFFCQLAHVCLQLTDAVGLQVIPQLEEGHRHAVLLVLTSWQPPLQNSLHQTQTDLNTTQTRISRADARRHGGGSARADAAVPAWEVLASPGESTPA